MRKVFLHLMVCIMFLFPFTLQASWSVWSESLLVDKIRPTYNPVSKPTTINLKGAKGEWLAFYVVMRANENVANFVPSVSISLSNGVNTIADSNWTEYMVQFVSVGSVARGSDGKIYRSILNHTAGTINAPATGANWATYWTEDQSVTAANPWVSGTIYNATSYVGGSPGQWPDPVVPYKDRYFGEIRNGSEMGWGKNIEANKTQAFLYEIYIPASTVAGNYSGQVSLRGTGATQLSQSISVNLQVWNFTIPLSWSYGSLFGVGFTLDTARLFGSYQLGYDEMTRSMVDHGIWPYIADSYAAPHYIPSTGGIDFSDKTFNDPNYGGKRWLDGTATNNPNNPRPYFGFRPRAVNAITDAGGVSGKASLYTTPSGAAFFDNGKGGTTVKTDLTHYFANGETVTIWGSAKYEGEYTISNVGTNVFDIPVVFSGDDHKDWYTRAINKRIFIKFLDDYDSFISANGYAAHTEYINKLIDEAPYPECCSYVSKIMDYSVLGGASPRSNMWFGQTIGGDGRCAPKIGGCEALYAKPYQQMTQVSEMMGFIRPTQSCGGAPRSALEGRVLANNDRVWMYTANTQNMDYNFYGQTESRTLPSWYIDTVKGGRENAASPLSMWIWDASGFHYWLINSAVSTCGLNDTSWDLPNCADPGRKTNGDGSLLYSGFVSGSRYDIGGVHNIAVESLRMKLWRWGMNTLEYAKLLESRGKKAVADTQIANMLQMPVSGNVWGTVSAFEAARTVMGDALSNTTSDVTAPMAPSGVVVK